MPGKFVLKSSKGGKFRFNLSAGNGQVVLTSEIYSSKAAARSGIALVGKNCGDDACFDGKTAKDGRVFFNLKSTNGEVIGKSQMYKSKAAMEKGIRSVSSNRRSRIEDQTGRARSDLTGVPVEIADKPELARSWQAAEDDLRDPLMKGRVESALERLRDASDETMTKSEFLAATDYSVA